ncbi:MAG: thioesterase family protein [Clostridia bacterium]|nr:thioesterase family protein [Clostridia bacterium]
MSFSVGTKNVVLSVVTEEKTALSAKSGSLPVFATPFLVALMEQAASELSEKEVEEGFTTVGTEISVSHLAPSVVGAQVRAVATLVKKEERKLFFFVEAFDDKGKIGEGEHTRFIVNKEKFMKKASERKS